MRARIHRGAHEIGGSCVELETDGARSVLDVGRPRTAHRGDVVALPDIPGLADATESSVGVVITHAHQDHWGLADQLAPGVPIFLGEATNRILREAAFWTAGLDVEPAGFLRHRVPFTVGPFTVTPFLNDHSAFDAYSVLVEADGRRLFYTGDIRGHGRKAALFDELLRLPPSPVDVLLMEGTNIRPGLDAGEPAVTETDVELAMATTMRATTGIVLVVTSSQNIDRLVTIYRAALRAERDLVVDLYTASIAAATGNPNIPNPGPEWPRIKVYVPRWQRVKVKETGQYHRVDVIRPLRLYEQDLATDPHRWVLLFSPTSGQTLLEAGALTEASAIWSMWAGYLETGSGPRLKAFLDAYAIPLAHHHTSGHASILDLQRLAAAINPTRTVPIHTFNPESFPEHLPNVTPMPDGQWWKI